MSSHGNGQQKTYRVTQAGPVKQSLTQLYARAKLKGEGADFVAALEHVFNRLRLKLRSGLANAALLKIHTVGASLHDS